MIPFLFTRLPKIFFIIMLSEKKCKKFSRCKAKSDKYSFFSKTPSRCHPTNSNNIPPCFLLVSFGFCEPYNGTSAEKVSVSSSADVADFRDAVQAKNSSILTGITSSFSSFYDTKLIIFKSVFIEFLNDHLHTATFPIHPKRVPR